MIRQCGLSGRLMGRAVFYGAALSFGLLVSGAHGWAQETAKEPASAAGEQSDKNGSEQPPQDRYAVMKGYASSGESENCIRLSQIRQSHVLSDREIFFEMLGGGGYLSTLPHRCSQLGFYESFSYSTSTGRLCNTDLITVINHSPVAGTTCGLGLFQAYEKAEQPQD
ncbi:hypothetical protein AQ1_01615 [alpha proteobacterium Q-1]|nr:hypothetical protein AQ1_01615 [alpha proteobacterium Q-1]